MTLELTKSNRKYLALLEAVDDAKAREDEALLSYNLRKAATAEAREAVTKFEGKHRGETLLKPHTLPKYATGATISLNWTSASTPFTSTSFRHIFKP